MWTPIAFERLEAGHGRLCQYPRQETDNPCNSKTPEQHAATYQKVTRRLVDGVTVNERTVYLCSNAMCAEKIKLNGHKLSQAEMNAASGGIHAPS